MSKFFRKLVRWRLTYFIWPIFIVSVPVILIVNFFYIMYTEYLKLIVDVVSDDYEYIKRLIKEEKGLRDGSKN